MNKKNLLLTTALFICLSGQAQHTIKLSELDLSGKSMEKYRTENPSPENKLPSMGKYTMK